MVESRLRAKWTPIGLAQRLRKIIRRPSDLILALEKGARDLRLSDR